jgi:hypothetical protein
MLEVGREDPSDTESDASHGGPRPYEPRVSDDTGESKGDSGGNGLIEESERVDETLHSSGRSSVSKLIGGDVDKQFSDSRRRNDKDWYDQPRTSKWSLGELTLVPKRDGRDIRTVGGGEPATW